jgi:hypothetical protein
MNKLAELQKVIDDFWASYSNPLAFDKPIIKIVDVFDDVAKKYVSQDLHNIKCYAVTRSEYHCADSKCAEGGGYEEDEYLATEEVCFRLRFDQEKLLLKKLEEYINSFIEAEND